MPPLAMIEGIFARTAESAAAHPKVMLALIAHQTRMGNEVVMPGVEDAVRWLNFPELTGVESLPEDGFETLVPPLLIEAIQHGVLPPSTDVEETMLVLASLFFGTPLLLCPRAPEHVGDAYASQLRLIWRGLRAAASA